MNYKCKEALEAVEAINQALHESQEGEDCQAVLLTFSTDGDDAIVKFLTQTIFLSSEDEREFDEQKNEWEPMQQYLWKQMNSILVDIEKISAITHAMATAGPYER